MSDLVTITNAILAATLPYFSEFAEKLNLPVRTPIQQSDLADFRVKPEWIESRITLKSGLELSFGSGAVYHFRLPSSYYSLQDPDEIPRFYGTAHLSREECERIVVRAVESLGYTNVFSQLAAPKVEWPEVSGGQTIPRYRFKWPRIDDETMPGVVAEVDSDVGRIHELFMLGKWFTNAPPKLSVALPVEPKPEPRVRLIQGAEALSEAHRDAMVRAIWPEVLEFLDAIGAPRPAGSPATELDLSHTTCYRLRDRLGCVLILKNGYQVSYYKGHVTGLFAPDAIFYPAHLPTVRPTREELIADLKFTRDELIEREQQVLKDRLKLDPRAFYLDTELFSRVRRPSSATGSKQRGCRRFLLQWGPPLSEEDVERLEEYPGRFWPYAAVEMEIDAVTGEIKCLGLDSSKFPPKPDPILELPEAPPIR